MITIVANKDDKLICHHCNGAIKEGQDFYKIDTKIPIDNNDVGNDVDMFTNITLQMHRSCFAFLSTGIMRSLSTQGVTEETATELTNNVVKGQFGEQQ